MMETLIQITYITIRFLCAPHDVIHERLADEYGENVAAMGWINENTYMQMYNSKIKDGWTLVVNRSDGNSCIVVAGTKLKIRN